MEDAQVAITKVHTSSLGSKKIRKQLNICRQKGLSHKVSTIRPGREEEMKLLKQTNKWACYVKCLIPAYVIDNMKVENHQPCILTTISICVWQKFKFKKTEEEKKSKHFVTIKGLHTNHISIPALSG